MHAPRDRDWSCDVMLLFTKILCKVGYVFLVRSKNLSIQSCDLVFLSMSVWVDVVRQN